MELTFLPLETLSYMLQSNTYPIMVVITLLVLRSQQGACAYQLVACRERALLTSKSYDCVHDLKVYNNWKSDKDLMWDEFVDKHGT